MSPLHQILINQGAFLLFSFYYIQCTVFVNKFWYTYWTTNDRTTNDRTTNDRTTNVTEQLMTERLMTEQLMWLNDISHLVISCSVISRSVTLVVRSLVLRSLVVRSLVVQYVYLWDIYLSFLISGQFERQKILYLCIHLFHSKSVTQFNFIKIQILCSKLRNYVVICRIATMQLNPAVSHKQFFS